MSCVSPAYSRRGWLRSSRRLGKAPPSIRRSNCSVFLPALAVLLAIACAAGWSLTTQRGDVWILFGLGAVCIQLLLTRQFRMRKELREANAQLAIRAADLRLTELVRRSSDLLVVISPDGLISFASPAIEPMLGMSSTQVLGTRADQLFGATHGQRMSEFLSAARGKPGKCSKH